MTTLSLGQVSAFDSDSSTLPPKIQLQTKIADCANVQTIGIERRPLAQFAVNFGEVNLPKAFCRVPTTEGLGELPTRQDAEGVTGLSTLHISPLVWKDAVLPIWDSVEGYGDFLSHWRDCKVPVYKTQPFSQVSAKAIIAKDGHLVKIVKERIVVQESGQKVIHKRGNISTFTKGSKRRLMRILARTDKSLSPHFVTLTYPDNFPDTKTVKAHLDTFGKRFMRKYPDASFVWRMEYKKRKSGENKGQIAPHFHLLVWGVSYGKLRQWIPENWYEVVGSNDPKHLVAGTSVEELHSWRGVMHYASKYLAKEDEDAVEGYTGRFWGVIGRKNLPLSAVLVIKLTKLQSIQATRLGRKYLKMKSKDLRFGLSWLTDGEGIYNYLDYLLGDHNGYHFIESLTQEFTGNQALHLW